MATSPLAEITERLLAGEDLDRATAATAATALAAATDPAELRRDFLAALARKGESADEVAGFAAAFRELATDPGMADTASQAIDIVGTGGDGAGSFNISTTAALLVAAMGQPVIKHGNRSITSRCGSADFLEALGIPVEADPAKLRDGLAQFGFAFLFAPAWHPAFRSIMPVRKALAAEGQKTIFNLLGPLINPAQPAFELLGVFSDTWVQPLAEAFDRLGLKAAAVAHCALPNGKSMDELTTVGDNHLAGAGELKGLQMHLRAETLGVETGKLDELAGGDAERNLELLGLLLEGKAPPALEDTVCLNAGAAWWICGRSPTVVGGFEAAKEALADGLLGRWLNALRTFYAT
ncbi:MAG: anthranilate phosphoribosyltransferase [Opitutales bacterium]